MQFNIQINGANMADKYARKEAIENILIKADTEALQMLSELLEKPNAVNSFKNNFGMLKTFI